MLKYMLNKNVARDKKLIKVFVQKQYEQKHLYIFKQKKRCKV